MTIQEARDMVRLLAAEFRIAAPSLGCSYVSRSHARCRFGEAVIVVHARDTDDVEEVVLHEFAHVLRFARVGRHRHDLFFYLMLRRVIERWRGSASAYRWENEYDHLRRLARVDGLTGPAPM